jgi:hypothetical protein
LNDFFKGRHNLILTSLASPLILGTKDHINLKDQEILEDI